jgi:hypothetical protein
MKKPINTKDTLREFLPIFRMVETIKLAIPLVTFSDSEDSARFHQILEKLIPPYRQMDQLYKDSFGVLNGDPSAARHFIDGLDLLADLPSVIRKTIVHLSNDKKSHNKKDGAHVHAKIIPSDGPIVQASRSIPVFAAGAMLVRVGLYDKKRFTNTIISVLGQFEKFGKVYTAALAAFGNDDGRIRFASILDGFIKGWEWPLIPDFNRSPLDLHEPDWHIDCLNATFWAIEDARHPAIKPIPFPYIITNITPQNICPPDTISIAGTNFGATAGKVVFKRADDTEFEITPLTWADTLITVDVPEAAVSVWLKIFANQIEVCGATVDLYGPGQVYSTFHSGPAVINLLTVNGIAQSPVVIQPGINLSIHSQIFGATNVQIEILNAGVSINNFNPVLPNPASSPEYNINYTLPVVANLNSTQLTIKVTANGNCIPQEVTKYIEVIITKDPQLVIEGIEVTQSVQHYKSGLHLTDPLTFGPDNSLDLVAGKAAWARVFINSLREPLFDNGRFTGVTGTLLVEEITTGGFPISSSVLSPAGNSSPIIYSTPLYSQRRGDINQTLNFIIPAHLMKGTTRLTVRLSSLTNIPFNIPAQFSLTLNPLLNQRLRIVFIPVGYNGPTSIVDRTPVVKTPPSLSDLLITLGDTLAMYPVNAKPCIRVLPPYIQSTVLPEVENCLGCCSINYVTLNNALFAIKQADGNRADVIYVGLYPLNMPGISGGCGGGGVAAATVYGPANRFEPIRYGKILAHEIGHAIGRNHAPCGAVGAGWDTNYPAYPPYDDVYFVNAVIGEYGIDIRNGHIHKPEPTLSNEVKEHDFMSYCGGDGDDGAHWQWISPYGYRHAIANLPGQGLTVCEAANNLMEVEPIPAVWLSGALNTKDKIEVTQIAEIELSNKLTGNILTLHAEILDAENKLLSAVSLRESKSMACGCSSSGAQDIDPFAAKQFNVFLPVLSNAAKIRICKDDKVLWERSKFSVVPEVAITHCEIANEKELEISWKSNVDAEALPEFWLQWRKVTNGKWKALKVCKAENKTSVELQYLPAGSIEIRVILQDGFSSAVSGSYKVYIPESPSKVAIINPVNGTILNDESGLLLWGYAVDCYGQDLLDENMTWYLNGKAIGTGTSLPMPMTLLEKKSDYQIELMVEDKYGSAKCSVTITV